MDEFKKSTYTLTFWNNLDAGGGGTPGAQYLNDLLDVNAPNPQDQQILVFDAVSGLWVTKSVTDIANPAPPDKAVQFNQADDFGGSSNFIWDYNTNRLAVGTQAYFGTLDTTTDYSSTVFLTNAINTSTPMLRARTVNTGIPQKEVVIDANARLGIGDYEGFNPEHSLHILATDPNNDIHNFVIEYRDSDITHFIRLRAGKLINQLSWDKNGPNALVLTAADNPTDYPNTGVIFWNSARGLAINYEAPLNNTVFSAPAQFSINALDDSDTSMSMAVYRAGNPKFRLFNDARMIVGTGYAYTDTGWTIDRRRDKERFVTRGNQEVWWSLWVYNKTDGVSFIAHQNNHFSLVIWQSRNRIWSANWSGKQFLVADNASYYSAPTFTSNTVFEVRSTTQGSLPAPRLTTTQRDGITNPPCGLLIFNTDTNHYNYYDCSIPAWVSLITSNDFKPAPPDQAIQFNNNGRFDGTSALVWDYNNETFRVNAAFAMFGFNQTDASSKEAFVNVTNKENTLLPPLKVRTETATPKVQELLFDPNYGLKLFASGQQDTTDYWAGISLVGRNGARIIVVDKPNNKAVSIGMYNNTAYIMSSSPFVPLGFGTADYVDDWTPTIGTVTWNYGRNWIFGNGSVVNYGSQITFKTINTSTSVKNTVIRVVGVNGQTVFSARDDNVNTFGFNAGTNTINAIIKIKDTQRKDTLVELEPNDTATGKAAFYFQTQETGYELGAEPLSNFYLKDVRLGAYKYYVIVNHLITDQSTNPANDMAASAVLTVHTPNAKGSLPAPRLTTTRRDNITNPACGLLIYNTDVDRYQFWSCSLSQWVDLISGGAAAAPPAGAVQFNDGTNNFGGSANFTWDNTNNVVSVNGKVSVQTSGATSTYTPYSLTYDTSTGNLIYQANSAPFPIYLLQAHGTILGSTVAEVRAWFEPGFFGPAATPPDISYNSHIATGPTWTNTTYANYPGSYGLATRFVNTSNSEAVYEFNRDMTLGFTVVFVFRVDDIPPEPTTGVNSHDLLTIHDTVTGGFILRLNNYSGTPYPRLELVGGPNLDDPTFFNEVQVGDFIIVTIKGTGGNIYGLATKFNATGGASVGGAYKTSVFDTGVKKYTVLFGRYINAAQNYASFGMFTYMFIDTYLGDTILRRLHAGIRRAFLY